MASAPQHRDVQCKDGPFNGRPSLQNGPRAVSQTKPSLRAKTKPQPGSPQSGSSLNVIFRTSPREPFLGLKGSNYAEGVSLLQEPSVTAIKEALKTVLATILAFFFCCPVIQNFLFTFESLTGRPRERSALSLQLQLVRDDFNPTERKEKMRRGKLGCRDRADKVAMISAIVPTILEINGKYDGGDARQLVSMGNATQKRA